MIDNGAVVEVTISVVMIASWLVVMWRYRHTLSRMWREKKASGLITTTVIWITLIALFIRSLFDIGMISGQVALLSSAVVRGMFLIVGIALMFVAPDPDTE